ncbi:hypothetical protein JXA40_06000 [bacterium]|nr:hypothetical protein [candidate division CSSED10-310 bacterium]
MEIKRILYIFTTVIVWILSAPPGFSSGIHLEKTLTTWPGQYVSIHQMELEKYRNISPGRHTRSIIPERKRDLTHTVYGWYPYWMGDDYLNLQWDLLSHISFFSLETNSNGNITDAHGWPGSWTGLIDTAQAAGVTLTITCTLFDSGAINTLIGHSGYRNTLITNLIDACSDGGATGVNIDFEGSSLNPENLVTFMQDLRAALSAAIPGSHLSMATPSVDWTGCFDYDRLAAACDDLIPMCYGYHWGGGSPGPVSPLTAGSVWAEYCVEWTVNDYLVYGTPRDKLAIGVPYYGYDWEIIGDPSVYPAQDAPGNATARTYEYILNNHGGYAKYWDPHSQTPWYYYYDGADPRQVWYDDGVSLGLKYDLVLDEVLDGIGIWALGYDGTYPDLWNAIETHFSVPVPPTATPMSPTSTPILPTPTVPASPSPFPTYTAIPTHTPVPPTNTSIPPSPTVPTGVPTHTAVPSTDTPLPPTATPDCAVLGVTLWMPSEFFRPGSPCSCRVFTCNPTGQTVPDIPLFVILDVSGQYFFAPGFSGLDFYRIDLAPGITEIEVLPEFPWPAGAGSTDGITWLAAMTNPQITRLFGEMDTWEFGWGE